MHHQNFHINRLNLGRLLIHRRQGDHPLPLKFSSVFVFWVHIINSQQFKYCFQLMETQNDNQLLTTAKSQMYLKHQTFIGQNREKKSHNFLNEYQSYLLNDKLIQSSDDSDDEAAQKPQIDISFLKKKKEKPEEQKPEMAKKPKRKSGLRSQLSSVATSSRQRAQLVQNSDNSWVFSQEGAFKLSWDILCTSLIFYEIVSIPFTISFDMTISAEFDILLDTIFLTDILLNFNTSFYKHGLPVIKRKKIAINYFQLWFWLDLCASFPYSRVIQFALESQEGNSNNAQAQTRLFRQNKKIILNFRLLRFIKFIKLMRLLRLAKLKVIFDKFEELIQLSTTIAAVMSFLKLSFFVLFWSHWLGCIFHFVAQNENPDGKSKNQLNIIENWLAIKGLYFETWNVRYVNSIYWAVTTMTTVGYGDISPQTPVERGLGVFFLLIACIVFSFTLNTIGAALQQIEDKKQEYSRKMKDVNSYMGRVKLPKQMQNKVKRYLSYIWDSEHPVNLSAITEHLNEQLKTEFAIQVNGSVLSQFHLFCQMFSSKILLETAQSFREQTAYPDEYVFMVIIKNINQYARNKKRNLGKNICTFFVKGQQRLQCIRINRWSANQRQIGEQFFMIQIKKGDYFGEIGFFGNCHRTASAKSKYFKKDIFGDSGAQSIRICNRSIYINLIKEKFQQIKDEINFSKDYSALKITCYCCNSDDHVIRDCTLIHFHVEIPMLLEIKEKCERTLAKQFVRRDITTFNAWKDFEIIQQKERQPELLKDFEQLTDMENEYDLKDDEMDDQNLLQEEKMKQVK